MPVRVAVRVHLHGDGALRAETPPADAEPGQGNCVYFSPFGADQLSNDPRTSYNLLQPMRTRNEVGHQLAEFVINGQLFDLPAGPLGIAFGAQHRRETIDARFDDFIQSGRAGFAGKSLSGSGDRTVKGAFVELGVPLFTSVDLQLAGRYEDYGKEMLRVTDRLGQRSVGATGGDRCDDEAHMLDRSGGVWHRDRSVAEKRPRSSGRSSV